MKMKANTLKDISEKEIIESLISNYRSKLAINRLIDEKMKKKYGMPYEDFEKKGIVKKKDFSWNAESDSMEWEHALAGIKYFEKKLIELEKYDD